MVSERIQRQIDRFLDEAEEAVTQGDWDIAADRAGKVLRLDPENQDALTYLAAAERDTGIPNSPAISSSQPFSAPTADQPTSFANGRYQVKRFLGEGGKKKVYLAHDTTLDRDVAFALIKAEGLDETSRTRIQREAQAMGRLGSHPHIVTVFDLGDEQGQPYMVTELMGGGDVEGAIEDAEDHRLPLEQAVKIAQETCRGMEFAHSRGIVHRDLKPGNVWLTSDSIAKIGDFGLAVALDRSRLTTEGMMVGTVSYMPPEQAMGGDVTPRSDLYSLGAMLYEMVTGRPPFLGDDSVAIIGQHINTPPVSPSWHNRQCPRPLEALILRLLAKNPSERPESAADVSSALDAIDLAVNVEEPAAGVDEAHALDSLAGGVFVGRQQEMGELKGCLEDALSGRGRLVMLVGEPGIGKTRTAQELATYAGLRGAQVLWGRSYEEQGVPPYWPWVQAIRSYARERDPDQLRSEMGSGAADIAEMVSDIRERLPDLPPPPNLEPEQARFRLFDSITAFLKTASQRQPLVLVLDDLHWADQPSLALLQFVARELGGTRLLLIGTYRDMELSRQHPLAEALGELTRERLFQRVLLRGLSEQDVVRFIDVATGAAPPRGLVSAVYTQTEGNPLFVTEVVRLLVQEKELTAESVGDGDSWKVRIPEGVREVIGRRLNRLTQRCNDTLTVASVIGREFELSQLGRLVEDMSEDRLLEVVEEAQAARVIEELPQTVGHYQFTHALTQETLAAELSTTRRVRLHARIGETLEELYGANAEAHAAELAHHFSEAQTVLGAEKLVHYSLIAGQRALAARAYEEASLHFQRGLSAKGVPLSGSDAAPDGDAAALLMGLGNAQFGTYERGQASAPITTLTRAFDFYSASGDVERAVNIGVFSQIALNTGGELLAKALELVSPDSHEASLLLSRRIMPLRGDYERAQDAFNRAMAIAEREKDLDTQLDTLVAMACVDFTHFRLDDSLERNRRAISLAGSVDQPAVEAHCRFDLMHVLYGIGDLEGAAPHAAAMLEAAERSGSRLWQAASKECNENICSAKGDWQAARSFIEQGLAISPRDPNLLGSQAILEFQVGDFGAGGVALERLLEAVRSSHSGLPSSDIFNHLYYSNASVVISVVARINGVTSSFDVAEERAGHLLTLTDANPAAQRAARISLGLIAVQRGDAAAAGKLYETLEAIAGTISPQSPHGPGLSGDRVLGLLAQANGDLNQAVSHFEDALVFCRKAGYRPELAWSCCDYADTLRERDGPRDHEKAVSLLDESLAISSELGMRPLMERVLSRREILRA